jgi:hypothetical protein
VAEPLRRDPRDSLESLLPGSRSRTRTSSPPRGAGPPASISARASRASRARPRASEPARLGEGRLRCRRASTGASALLRRAISRLARMRTRGLLAVLRDHSARRAASRAGARRSCTRKPARASSPPPLRGRWPVPRRRSPPPRGAAPRVLRAAFVQLELRDREPAFGQPELVPRLLAESERAFIGVARTHGRPPSPFAPGPARKRRRRHSGYCPAAPGWSGPPRTGGRR